MEAETGPFDEAVLDRVMQLIGKTNQFNLTTRRYSEAEVRQMMVSPDFWTGYFKLMDRFGDNGLIGLIIAHRKDDVIWDIDSWLMSCRVIGREMEEFMLQTLADEVTERGGRVLTGRYIPTKKNALVSDLYDRMHFARIGEDKGSVSYRLSMDETEVPRARFIRAVKSAPI